MISEKDFIKTSSISNRIGKRNVTFTEDNKDFSCNNIISEEDLNIDINQSKLQTLKTSQLIDDLPVGIIENTSIGLFNYDEMRKLTKGIIINDASTDVKHGTLNDPKMGTVSIYRKCGTCKQTQTKCPGHYGLIEFPKNYPIFHPHPIFINLIVKVLNSICHDCGVLKVTKEFLEENKLLDVELFTRIKKIEKISENTGCINNERNKFPNSKCCRENRIYIITKADKDDKRKKIEYKLNKNEIEKPANPKEVLDIFNSISNEDAELLGFDTSKSHPRDLIMRGLLVLPLCGRPDNITIQRPDDMTLIYRNIIKIVEKINKFSNTKQNEGDLNDNIKNLERAVYSLIDTKNNTNYIGKGNTPMNTIRSRLQGKGGYIRKNIQGKRTNFSARAVASLGMDLKYGEIGVPIMLARNLTVNVIVTSQNIDYINSLKEEGKIVTLTKNKGFEKGRSFSLNKSNKDLRNIEIGDEVDRWLQDGDIVMFNRYPSIHKYSMLSARAVLHKNNDLTIKIHMAYTSPLNADFDGDEINLHSIQTKEGIEELQDILSVEKCIISEQDNSPISGAFLDIIYGSYMLTMDNTFIDPEVFLNLISYITRVVDLEDLNRRRKKFFVPQDSGKHLFSALLPPTLFYNFKGVLIQEGILISGVITGSHIGNKSNSLIQAIYKEFGNEETVTFFTDIYFLIPKYNNYLGVTISLNDCKGERGIVKRLIEKETTKAKVFISQMYKDNPTSLAELERIEKEISVKLSNIKNIGDKLISESFPDTNVLKIMNLSGAKGKPSNIAYISGMLGQIYIENSKRIPLELSNGKRCLPVFDEDNLDPESRGFSLNGYLSGLNPAEYFFNSMAGREGIISRACSTAITGDLNHTLNKALEDEKIAPDNSVRHSNLQIVQFLYGDDGLNPTELENIKTYRGNIAFFVNPERLAGKMNNEFGFYLDKDTNKWIELKDR